MWVERGTTTSNKGSEDPKNQSKIALTTIFKTSLRTPSGANIKVSDYKSWYCDEGVSN